MKRRVLICGSRDFIWAKEIRELVYSLPDDAVVIHGDATGADTIANRYAVERGLTVLKFPAKWEELGRRAGPIRNQQMLDEGKPTEVHAFYTDKATSRGTADMVRRSRKAGLPVTENQ